MPPDVFPEGLCCRPPAPSARRNELRHAADEVLCVRRTACPGPQSNGGAGAGRLNAGGAKMSLRKKSRVIASAARQSILLDCRAALPTTPKWRNSSSETPGHWRAWDAGYQFVRSCRKMVSSTPLKMSISGSPCRCGCGGGSGCGRAMSNSAFWSSGCEIPAEKPRQPSAAHCGHLGPRRPSSRCCR